MRGSGHTHNPENGHPAVFQAPITRNVNFSTGQLSGFFWGFFQKFLFWALYGIPEVLRWRKPAYLELFGLRIGWKVGDTYGWGVFGNQGLFWIPALYLLIPGVHPLSYRIT